MASSSNEAEQEDQKSAAGEVIASSQDLITQILLCLKGRSVGNSKLVSKQWLSITSYPDFIRSHSLRHGLPLSGLFLHYFARQRALAHNYVPLNPIDNQADHPFQFVKAQNSLGLNILQSCNGLLLCSASDTEYYICNPTTLQRKRLALPKGVLPGGDFGLNLAFDPKISPHYKVVCIRRCLGQKRYQLEVYSSETCQWKTSGEPFSEPDVLDFKRGVFCKGKVHWLKKMSNCLYFDVDTESMRSTPEPPPWKQCPSHSHEYFGQSNGCLYFVVKRHLPNFSLLQMKEDYSGWFVKCVIHLDGLAAKLPSMARNFHNTPRFYPHYECNVLCITGGGEHDNDEENGVNIVLSMPGEIVVIDPETNASKKIADLVLEPLDASVWYKDFFVHEYFETVCPV